VGIRDILRIAGRENVQETVRVGYSGGRFKVDALTEVKLGALAQLDNEAFVRVEIEGHEVCSVIWPFSSKRLGDAAVKITLPISVTSADEGIVGRIGEPKAAPIPVDEIQTSLTNSRPPTHCIALAELGPLLCKLGKLPPDLCAIVGVAPAGAGNGKTAPKTEPKAGPKPDTVDPLTTPGRRCREETGDPCPTALPVAWPAELPLPAGAGLIRVKGEDVEFPKEKRGAAQERLRKEIARRRRLLLPPPRPCDTNVDNDPNAPRDAHHKQPLALGGRDADENVCALDADLHQVGHPRLNNQVEFLDVYEEECNYCSPRVNDHPAGQTYFIRGRK
jgi:hypothetical protein